MVRLVNFSSKYWDLFRGLNPNLDGIAIDPRDFDVNVVANHDSFIHFS